MVHQQPPTPLKTSQLSKVQATLIPPLVLFAVITIATLLSDFYFGNVKNGKQKPPPSIAQYILGVFIALYWCTLHLSRYLVLGFYYNYELLWGCNVGLILSSIGMIFNRPLFIGASCCVVAVDQLCWYIDILGYFVTNKFVIGVAAYMGKTYNTQ